jgi:hypothetical protein
VCGRLNVGRQIAVVAYFSNTSETLFGLML